MARLVLFALLFAAAGAAPARAAAPGVCDEAEQDVVETEVIVPCAMAESGAFGAACADAPVYVVTPTGLVLCQVTLAVIAAPQGPTTEISSRPTAPTATPWSWSAAHGVVASAPQVPPQAEGCAPRCLEDVAGPPADVPPTELWGPS